MNCVFIESLSYCFCIIEVKFETYKIKLNEQNKYLDS